MLHIIGFAFLCVFACIERASDMQTLHEETGSVEEADKPEPKEKVPAACENVKSHPYFDGNPEFFRSVPNGDFPKMERAKRTKRLPNGEKVLEDIGLTFYRVRRGDTIIGIRRKLGAYDRFSYLKESAGKLKSFNIPPHRLQANMWIPVPIEETDRHVSDAQFRCYAAQGVRDILDHEAYAPFVREILDGTTMWELAAAMLAIAKNEAGEEEQPIGFYAYHRWEPHRRAFSFTAFHVLMEGPGLRARRRLGMTEGQVNHPRNAVQLFLGFIVEKNRHLRTAPSDLFPLGENMERMARFYNGAAWRRYNPHYVRDLRKYYEDALTKTKEGLVQGE